MHTCTAQLLLFLMPTQTKRIMAYPAILLPFTFRLIPFSYPSSNPFISAAAHSLVSQLSRSVPPAVDPAVWAR